MTTQRDLERQKRRYEDRLARPFPPVTPGEDKYLSGLWKAYKEGRGKSSPPWVVARSFSDPGDEGVIAAVTALVPIGGEPWRVRGVLRAGDGAPQLTRIAVEHRDDPAVEPTAVLRRIPAATIRDRARAWLQPQEMIAEALHAQGGWAITPKQRRWARRVSAEARKQPLTRGRKGYPAEHYRRIALLAVELHADGARDVVRRIAREEQRPYQTVRDWIYRARELGFLEPATKQGRADFRPGPNLYPKEDATNG